MGQVHFNCASSAYQSRAGSAAPCARVLLVAGALLLALVVDIELVVAGRCNFLHNRVVVLECIQPRSHSLSHQADTMAEHDTSASLPSTAAVPWRFVMPAVPSSRQWASPCLSVSTACDPHNELVATGHHQALSPWGLAAWPCCVLMPAISSLSTGRTPAASRGR